MFCRSIPFGKGVLQKRLCYSGVAQLIYDACFLICTSSFFATPSACGNKNRQLKLVVQSVLRTQAIQSGTTKPIPTHFFLVPHFLRLSPTSSSCDEGPSHSPPATSYQSPISRLFTFLTTIGVRRGFLSTPCFKEANTIIFKQADHCCFLQHGLPLLPPANRLTTTNPRKLSNDCFNRQDRNGFRLCTDQHGCGDASCLSVFRRAPYPHGINDKSGTAAPSMAKL